MPLFITLDRDFEKWIRPMFMHHIAVRFTCHLLPANMLTNRQRVRYSDPAPPRTHLSIGAGWGYGVGCGIGGFFGVGVATTPLLIGFGAGTGVGVFCGVGFGAGGVLGLGSSFVPMGSSTAVFYSPRLDAAEDFVLNPPAPVSNFFKKAIARLSAIANIVFPRRYIMPNLPREPKNAPRPSLRERIEMYKP